MGDPTFNLESVAKCNVASKYLFLWVQAMYDYYTVYTTTKPLREKLIFMRKLVEEKNASLAIKKSELAKINKKIAELESTFNAK